MSLDDSHRRLLVRTQCLLHGQRSTEHAAPPGSLDHHRRTAGPLQRSTCRPPTPGSLHHIRCVPRCQQRSAGEVCLAGGLDLRGRLVLALHTPPKMCSSPVALYADRRRSHALVAGSTHAAAPRSLQRQGGCFHCLVAAAGPPPPPPGLHDLCSHVLQGKRAAYGKASIRLLYAHCRL